MCLETLLVLQIIFDKHVLLGFLTEYLLRRRIARQHLRDLIGVSKRVHASLSRHLMLARQARAHQLGISARVHVHKIIEPRDVLAARHVRA